jgi:hypothetical protein
MQTRKDGVNSLEGKTYTNMDAIAKSPPCRTHYHPRLLCGTLKLVTTFLTIRANFTHARTEEGSRWTSSDDNDNEITSAKHAGSAIKTTNVLSCTNP